MSGIGINYFDNNTSIVNTKLNNHKEIKEQVILNADKVKKTNIFQFSNAGSNNYLGEKSVQDELKKLAN